MRRNQVTDVLILKDRKHRVTARSRGRSGGRNGGLRTEGRASPLDPVKAFHLLSGPTPSGTPTKTLGVLAMKEPEPGRVKRWIARTVGTAGASPQERDFVTHLPWGVVSRCPLVEWFLPSDTITIATHGNAFHIDTSVIVINTVQLVFSA